MCNECEKYKKEGHNYCRMCGFHLTNGFVQNVRIAVGYFTNEKFCGYCGKKRNDCTC
ncbi:hypothetical protein BN1195_04434 [Chryseobacterium oranimense G311]|nr:hypothetical protein BN1195_04434 [Chryseobacterium oranimense G311]